MHAHARTCTRGLGAQTGTPASEGPPGAHAGVPAVAVLRRAFASPPDAASPFPAATQVWWIKCRALTNKNWIDEGELPEEGLGEMLLDDNSTAQVARPGTSFTRPESSAAGGPSPAVRPTSTGGRPLSGFARPGSGLTRSGTGMSLERAMTSSRLGTAMTRPVTTSGRFVRLGTASLASEPGGPFVNLERINMQKYAARPAMAKALCDYIFHVAANPKKAVELCAAATQVAQYKDWVWKARLGKGYFQLGLYREAEQQLLSSLKEQEMATTYLQVCMCVRIRARSLRGVGASACVRALFLCVGGASSDVWSPFFIFL
jgi:tetratricopeptide repeat protein 8